MKATPLILSLSFLLLSTFASAAELERGVVYSISTGVRTSTPAAQYHGHLLPAMMDYATALSQPGQEQAAEHYRKCAIDLARRFPREANDLHMLSARPSGSDNWATPLSLAVRAQDETLVFLLLRLGAYPFTPNGNEIIHDLPLLPGVSPSPKVAELLQTYAARHNPLVALMPKVAHNSRDTDPFAGFGPARRHLAETHEAAYLGEPGELNDRMLYNAYNRLASPQATILQVQPLARCVLQPAPQGTSKSKLYASVIHTARIVKAIKGNMPEQELVSWSSGREGSVPGAVDGEWVQLPADTPPMVIDTWNGGLARPGTVEGNTLKLGGVDPFAVRSGEQCLRCFEQVLADFPELKETTPATAEELAAARQLLEQAPCLVRATIVQRRVEVDEATATAQIHETARLRDPLKGAVILGALADWSDLHYTRRLPLSKELRAAAGNSSCPRTPAILMLNTTEGGRDVQQVIDAENDAAMFRALNQAVFMPLAE